MYLLMYLFIYKNIFILKILEIICLETFPRRSKFQDDAVNLFPKKPIEEKKKKVFLFF